MKETAVEWLVDQIQQKLYIRDNVIEQAKEIEEKNLLEMLHKFGFDYTYNYKGEKTIYEWIPEWFEEYKRLLTI
jgi:hypothetical protein